MIGDDDDNNDDDHDDASWSDGFWKYSTGIDAGQYFFATNLYWTKMQFIIRWIIQAEKE